jgi:glutathione reductase (NADPH)
MPQSFDLIVIGTGSAATSIAFPCREAGWTVAMIDSLPFGGTCALRGCDPKKILVGAAEAVDWSRRMQGKGLTGMPAIDWPELMRFKRTFTSPFPERLEKRAADAGIAAFHGRARFTGPHTLEVAGERLEARHVAIAAGTRPATLNIPGEEFLATSDRFLELDALPPRLVFVGGGYIAFEFAHLARRAGAEVTIVHRGAQPLEGFDPDLVDRLEKHSRDVGIAIELNAPVAAIEKTAGGFRAVAGSRVFEGDLIVHAAGRVPNIDDLDLPAAGIDREPRGVRVNEFLQSVSNPAVYAAGDCAATAGLPLTPIAGYEGNVVAENLLHGNRTRAEYPLVPSVVFSIPPLARAGLSEAEAREKHLDFRVNLLDTAGWYSSRRVGEDCSATKVLIENGTDRILGVHLLGPEAGEVINLFMIAMRAGMTATQMKELIYTYPTQGSDVRYML